MGVLLEPICLLLTLYSLALLAWIVLSWVRISASHPLARVTVFLDRIIYPVLLPLRRVIPPLRLGGAMLDLSPIVIFIGIRIIQGLIGC